MPTSADLFELFFMGPGLLCFFPLAVGLYALWKRLRVHRQLGREKQVGQLIEESSDLLNEGRVTRAKTAALKAIAIAKRPPAIQAPAAHLVLAKALAREGDDAGSLEHLHRASSLSLDDPHQHALVSANLSLVLRRLGHVTEALGEAAAAAHLHEGFDSYPEPFMRAGAGWANVALALAQTDAGQDGRRAATEALRVFQELEKVDGSFGEGVALAYYANGYALAAQKDPAASDFAYEAWDRFAKLHAEAPLLYRNRLADTTKLLQSL